MKIQKFLIIGLVAFCLTSCSNDGGAGDKSVEVETSSATTIITTTSPVVTTTTITVGSEPEITTTVPSTSLTQGTTSKVTTTTSSTKVNGTTKTTTTKKPATVTTTKKTTTKTTTTTKKTTTTAKTTTKATTTTTSYVPFSKPVEFVYDETNDVWRATMSSTLTIAYKQDLYGQLHIYEKPNTDESTDGRTLYGTATCPLELTLKGKTSNGKFYYATAVWGSSRKTYSGYIPVDISCFIDVYFDYDAAYEIFELINIERQKVGVEPLKYDFNLEKCAMFRSEELYTYFSHSSPAETLDESIQLEIKYKDAYHEFSTENIVKCTCGTYYETFTAKEINDVWVNSSGHYASMICDDWKYVGVGVYRCEIGTYAVQIYGDGAYM